MFQKVQFCFVFKGVLVVEAAEVVLSAQPVRIAQLLWVQFLGKSDLSAGHHQDHGVAEL
jgi:hypothetical protein